MAKKLRLGILAAAALAFGMVITGCDDTGGGGGPESIFDFQAWMRNHNQQHPRTDLPLSANIDAAANPSHLGGQRNHGSWPFWNTGNQDIVIEGPVAGRNTYQMAVPNSLTGGLAFPNYGSHGVIFRLSGPQSLGAQVGDTVRIAGYVRGAIVGTAQWAPGVGLRRAGTDNPAGNIHSVRWAPNLTDHPFEIEWTLVPQDFNSILSWNAVGPVLSVVREPSQQGIVMIIQEFEVIRP